MNCNDFEAKLDFYLDGVLPSGDANHAREHLSRCSSCETLVSSYQQTASLLRAAVADRAAAVDLSGLWRDIESRLGPAELSPKLASPSWIESLRQWWSSLPVLMPVATPLRAAAWAGAVAVVVVAVSMTLPQVSDQGQQKSVQLASGRSQQPSVRTMKSKSVRIDSLEVAEGYTVTTWMRPRTNTRVIWIANNDDFGVADLSFSR